MASSWGNYPKITPKNIHRPQWLFEIGSHLEKSDNLLAFGMGRSYGDVCLNSNTMIASQNLNRIIKFDKQTGILECEVGITLQEILEIIVPHSWFLPVSPGTQFVTLGGAIANDIHGKNHHNAGTFGRYCLSLQLIRSNGEILECSLENNSEIFKASIGGLGLTGFISKASIQLKSIVNSYIKVEKYIFNHLNGYFDLSKEFDKDNEYTVAWIDCLRSGSKKARGVYWVGNHSQESGKINQAAQSLYAKKKLMVPFYFPSGALNLYTCICFNRLFFQLQKIKPQSSTVGFQNYFYPLDHIHNWNKIYGKNGFFQYQFVIPYESGPTNFAGILDQITTANIGSFFAVLKNFGSIESPGLLSFPSPGYTLALDFPNQGQKTLKLLDTLDEMVLQWGGRVYPAKDSRMNGDIFKKFYPNWTTLDRLKDPNFSSAFWERVTHE